VSLEIRWLREAIRNMVEEGEYIALDDPDMAREVTRRIRAAVDNLAQFPHLGRPGRVSGTRELVVPKTSYIVPYRVYEDHVEIVRVLHAARKWPKNF